MLCQTTVVGNRRIPKESILARLFSRPGDPTIRRSWSATSTRSGTPGYFEDVRIERVDEPTCIQLTVYVRERPTIREVNFKGNNAITVSDIMDRFKKEKVGVTVESQYDPTKVKRAEVVLQEMLGEHGHQFATIKTEIKTLPPAYVAVTFNIKEGPTVKVGKIEFTGNTHLTGARAAQRDALLQADRHSALDLPGEHLPAHVRRQQAGRRCASWCARSTATRATPRPTRKSRESRIRNAGGINPFTLQPSTGKRADILIPD